MVLNGLSQEEHSSRQQSCRLYDADKPDDGPVSLTRRPARHPIVF